MLRILMSILRSFILLAMFFCGTNMFAQFAGGSGTDQDPYLIQTADHLNNIRNYLSSVFRQTADIDLNVPPYNQGDGWVPIGFYTPPPNSSGIPFTGKYHGDGFSIYDLYINRPGYSYYALFRYAVGACFSNLNLCRCNVTASGSCSGLVAIGSNLNIRNCHVTGDFSGSSYLGGLASSLSHSTLDLCSAACILTGTGSSVGGLLGAGTYNVLTDCFSTRIVNGNGATGGLIGNCTYSDLSRCFSTANVNGEAKSTGGLAGRSYSSHFESCYATGDVAGGPDVGGFGGHYDYSDLSNCFATGNVTGWGSVGGLLGTQCVETTLLNTYSTGFVTAGGSYGGLVGRCFAAEAPASSYWDMQTSGQAISAGGEGRTTDEMTFPYAHDTFVGWDFVTIWQADINGTVNGGYPYLTFMSVTPDEDEYLPEVPRVNLTNYPNPFHHATTFKLSLPHSSKVKLAVYNLKGQLVKTLITALYAKGEHQFEWDGTDTSGQSVAGGVYICKMDGPDFHLSRRLILIK
jgi:hypothetical protein